MVLGIFAQRRRCSVAQCVCLQAKMNVITPPPHPTQPKPDPSTVRVFASEDERYYPTPTHPTQPKPDPSSVRVFASEDERYQPPPPTPPNQSPTPAQCVCLQAKMNVISPPHPTPQTLARARVRLKTRVARVCVRLKTRAQVRPACACAREPKNACAGEAQTDFGTRPHSFGPFFGRRQLCKRNRHCFFLCANQQCTPI